MRMNQHLNWMVWLAGTLALVVTFWPALAAAGAAPAAPVLGLSVFGQDLRQVFWSTVRGMRIVALLVCHVLLAWRVFGDLQHRGRNPKKFKDGEAIWVILALLGGFFGAGIYALVRLADKPPDQS